MLRIHQYLFNKILFFISFTIVFHFPIHEGGYELPSRLESLHSPRGISEWSWLLFCFSLDMPFVRSSFNSNARWYWSAWNIFYLYEFFLHFITIFKMQCTFSWNEWIAWNCHMILFDWYYHFLKLEQTCLQIMNIF